MAATAERIDFVAHRAINIAHQGGQFSELTVDFRVFQRGPAHVVGLIYTTDFWKTPQDAIAAFQHFEGAFEVWQAKVTVSGNNASFEYVIFCNDYRDIQNVRRIYNTNLGETFRIVATF